jgi:hypothetical protein
MKLPKISNLPSDEYGLRGEEVIRGRGARPEDRVQVSDILSWQVHPEMVFDMVQIKLLGNQELVWLDKHDDLKSILRRAAPGKELSEG